MKYVRESRKPSIQSQSLIDDAIRSISEQQSDLGDWFERYAESQKCRLALDLDRVGEDLPEHAELLECGATPLILTSALKGLPYRVRAVDIAPERFSSAIGALALDVDKANIEEEALPYGEESFDAVLFNEVFEHLRIDVLFTMREIFRVLRPGGILLLSTPNLISLNGYRNLCLHGKTHVDIFQEYQKLETVGHMGHVREYTAVEVSEFLEKIGFSVRRVIYRGPFKARPGLKGAVIDGVYSLFPKLRPYFTVVAQKQ